MYVCIKSPTKKKMKAQLYGKTFNAKETNGKYFYWSPRALRWLPVAKANIIHV